MPLGRTRQTPPQAGTEVAQRTPAPPAPQQPGTVTAPEPIPAELLAKIEAAVAGIPDSTDDDSWGIAEQLLAAETPDQLNAPWSGTSGRDLAGRTLLIHDITRRPSDYDGGPEIFLVVHATDISTGEAVTFTTSALAVLLQLAQAHSHGWLPVTADIVAARKPTKRGRVPYHLNITRIRVTD